MSMLFCLIFPECAILGVLLVLLCSEIFYPDHNKNMKTIWTASLIGAALVLFATLTLAETTQPVFHGMFIVDHFASFFKVFFTLAFMVLLMITREFFQDRTEKTAEFVLIQWICLAGMFFLVSAHNLLVAFIALEIMTLSFYIMAAYLKHELGSIEAGLKYLILGSLASAFIIYGISLIYVATGSLDYSAIQKIYVNQPENRLILFGILLMISGLGFKVAAAPFQFWAPDVYEGAPTPVTASLAVASKAAAFAFLMRLLFSVFISFNYKRVYLFSALAAMTMLYGNLGALGQTNIKRLFGYSSIAHAGYLLVGIAAGKKFGTAAVLYYLIAYAISTLSAFCVITYVEKTNGHNRIEGYRGLAKRSPLLAGIFFIALLSLAGVPPLAGFFGKFLVLLAAVKVKMSWLALLGLLGVAISLFYYLSLVRVMYFEESSNEEPILVSNLARFVLIGLACLTIIAGLWQYPFLNVAYTAARSLF